MSRDIVNGRTCVRVWSRVAIGETVVGEVGLPRFVWLFGLEPQTCGELSSSSERLSHPTHQRMWDKRGLGKPCRG